jgi:predicted nucleic acid-binding protein
LERFTDHVLVVDLEVARAAAAIADRNAVKGFDPGAADTMIAATAVVRGMTLLTRNIRHFTFAGATIVDPFKTLPP